jgi:hypothetical protein
MTAALIDLGAEEAGAGAEEFGAGDIPSGSVDLGHGNRMVFSDEQFRLLLHSPEVVEALRGRSQGVCDECNDTKKKKHAVYEVLIQNDDWTTRARGFVKPGNADAYYDDARYSTMLKAAANAPNDPKLSGEQAPSGTDFPTPGGEDDGTAAAAAEEGAEMADAAEMAEAVVLVL